MKIDDVKQPILYIIIAILLIILFFHKCKKEPVKYSASDIAAMQNQIKVSKDKENRYEYKISALAGEASEFKEKLKNAEQHNIHLSDEIKRVSKKITNNTQSATSITQVVTVTAIGEKIGLDLKDSCDFTAQYKDQWVELQYKSKGDTFKLSYKDSLDIVTNKQPKGFLGLGEPEYYTSVTPYSPYNKVTGIASYTKKLSVKKTRFSVGVQAGYGITLFGPSPYIGIGGQFNIVKF